MDIEKQNIYIFNQHFFEKNENNFNKNIFFLPFNTLNLKEKDKLLNKKIKIIDKWNIHTSFIDFYKKKNIFEIQTNNYQNIIYANFSIDKQHFLNLFLFFLKNIFENDNFILITSNEKLFSYLIQSNFSKKNIFFIDSDIVLNELIEYPFEIFIQIYSDIFYNNLELKKITENKITKTNIFKNFEKIFLYLEKKYKIFGDLNNYNQPKNQTNSQKNIKISNQNNMKPIIENKIEKVSEPIIENKIEKVVEPIIQNKIEKVSEPIIQNKIEPIIQNKIEPIIQNKIEPIIEKVSEPIIQNKIEPIIEKVSEPIIQNKIEKVSEPIIENKIEKVVESIIENKIEKVVEPIIENKMDNVLNKNEVENIFSKSLNKNKNENKNEVKNIFSKSLNKNKNENKNEVENIFHLSLKKQPLGIYKDGQLIIKTRINEFTGKTKKKK